MSGSGPWTLSATIDTSSLTNGTYIVSVRAQDAVGQWSNIGTTSLVVSGAIVVPPANPLYFSTAGNASVPGVGGADDADIYYWNSVKYARSINASGLGSLRLPAGANVDAFERIDATHFYMSFTGRVNPPGPLGYVDDEDVVYYHNGVWSLYFNGSAHGLAASDIDAISIYGGRLYFSLTNATRPPGVSGAGDDADIYRWNTGNSFTRWFDASARGASTANVDGLSIKDLTHFYLSYSSNTSVPGIGSVQDEDVVYDNNGAWSVYFDGTAHGLTSSSLDVDAIDVP